MLKWMFMLTKRLYKKAVFVLILVSIPVVVLALSIIANQDSGFVNVALAQEDSSDALSNEIIDELLNDKKLIRFSYFESPEAAKEAVEYGKSDAAWIFPAEMEERIEAFCESPAVGNYLVDVIEREENVMLRFTHEKLVGVLYKRCTENIYMSYIKEKLPELKDSSDTVFFEEYHSFDSKDKLFEFAFPDGKNADRVLEDSNYLIAPVRGLLSVLVMICGMAAALYYMKDEKKGTFSLLSYRKKSLIELIGQFLAIINVGIVMMLAIFFVGINTTVLRELAILILFIISASLFCVLLRRILRSIKIFASLIPLFIVLMFGLCPVFFDFRQLNVLQNIFPPTYYIGAVNNDRYIILNLVYILILSLLISLLYLLEKRKES